MDEFVLVIVKLHRWVSGHYLPIVIRFSEISHRRYRKLEQTVLQVRLKDSWSSKQCM